MNRKPVFLITMLAFGFAFFYIPILSMIIYSFNDSRLATVWGGFSTKWYVSLWSNKQVMAALWLSLKIAFISASIATILGTMAGIALARFSRFRGRVLFSGLVTAPLIMPEVIIPQGQTSITVTVEGGRPGTGNLFLKGFSSGELTIPTTVSPR